MLPALFARALDATSPIVRARAIIVATPSSLTRTDQPALTRFSRVCRPIDANLSCRAGHLLDAAPVVETRTFAYGAPVKEVCAIDRTTSIAKRRAGMKASTASTQAKTTQKAGIKTLEEELAAPLPPASLIDSRFIPRSINRATPISK